MTSPFPKSTSLPGDGRIVVGRLPAGGSGLETISYQYPLKLIAPSPTVAQKAALVFLLSYGGGLVGGDGVKLSIHVRRGASLSLVTQGHTKIFKSATPDIVTSQRLQVQVDEEAAVCLLPDPVQPFEDSVYEQAQVFTVGKRASLCLLDWVTQGRAARGEDWSFTRWTGRNEVWTQGADPGQRGRLLIRDNVILSQDASKVAGLQLKETMHGLSVLGTLILTGPVMASMGDFFMAEFAALPRIGSRDFRSREDRENDSGEKPEFERWRAQRIEMERQQGILWSAAQVRGCVIVKFGAATVEAGRSWIGTMLARQGSIASYFGDAALMCVGRTINFFY
ncbi:UreD-domain-containing protein [Trichoderma citrinoviride]|uniref:UreD-domain-containing protein n=1 Tax=Trichoderma citrinoviride TaxID=58853 RepID=A0A2T4B0U9_9HYPO|nr:UreD-domain-containing protein [Trichoderma citrinoviride]PTB62858.1 UreD-domain-containing protein [Trichoderma citrinoviride]